MRHHPLLLLMLATLPILPAAAQEGSGTGWERVGRAARQAALSPRTWAPLLGALALRVGDADHKLQSWAAEHTPLFGSQASADARSDDFKRLANGLWIASALWPREAEPPGDWLADRAQVLLVQGSARLVTSKVVGELKEETARMRPNGAGPTSFPSDHATRVALYTTFTRDNVQRLGWSERSVGQVSLGLDALTGATAWARIEADQHYPSDVLAGMALGHFMGAFFNAAFLPAQAAGSVQVQLLPQRRQFALQLHLAF